MKTIINTLILMLLSVAIIGGCETKESWKARWIGTKEKIADNCAETISIKQKKGYCVISCTSLVYPGNDIYITILPCSILQKGE